MNYYYIIGIGVSGYIGYYYGKSWINNYISNKVIKKLNEISNSEEVKFKQLHRNTSALVVFEHGGKSHNVCIPYDQSKAKYMRRKSVFLVGGDNKTEITHKAGVPYLLSAAQMGGDKIVVEKDNITLKVYESDEIPMYLEI